MVGGSWQWSARRVRREAPHKRATPSAGDVPRTSSEHQLAAVQGRQPARGLERLCCLVDHHHVETSNRRGELVELQHLGRQAGVGSEQHVAAAEYLAHDALLAHFEVVSKLANLLPASPRVAGTLR